MADAAAVIAMMEVLDCGTQKTLLQRAEAWAKEVLKLRENWQQTIEEATPQPETDSEVFQLLGMKDAATLEDFRYDIVMEPWSKAALPTPYYVESAATKMEAAAIWSSPRRLVDFVWCWHVITSHATQPQVIHGYFEGKRRLETAVWEECLSIQELIKLEASMPCLVKVLAALEPYEGLWRVVQWLERPEGHRVMRLKQVPATSPPKFVDAETGVPVTLGGICRYSSKEPPYEFRVHPLFKCATTRETEQNHWLCRVHCAWPSPSVTPIVVLDDTAWPAKDYPAWHDLTECQIVAAELPTADMARTLIRAWSTDVVAAALQIGFQHEHGKLQYLPTQFLTKDLAKRAVIIDPENYPYIPAKFRTSEFITEAVLRHGEILQYLTKDQQTRERCSLAIRDGRGCNIQFVHSPWPELLEEALVSDPYALFIMDKALVTPNLMQFALAATVFRDPPIEVSEFMEWFPDEWRTEEVWKEAIRADPDIVEEMLKDHPQYEEFVEYRNDLDKRGKSK